MALLFLDSFDHYLTADLTEKHGGISGVTIVAGAGRHASAALQLNTQGNYCSTRVFAPGSSALIIGFAYKYANPPNLGVASAILTVYTGGTLQFALGVNPAGNLVVYRGNTTAGTLLGTAIGTLPIATFVYLELKVVVHPSAGSVTLLVDTVPVLTLSGPINTAAAGSAGWTAVVWESSNSSRVAQVDDVYIADDTGSAPWNTFLGDCRVDARYPTAEGASSAWTPLSGTDNALMVDETAPNDDTDYVSTATLNATDTHVTQDAPVVGAAIYGVQHCLSMKKSDSGICTVAPVIRHSTTDYPGAALSPTTAYAYGLQIAQVNPGTSAQWTEAGFNAAEFGYKRVS